MSYSQKLVEAVLAPNTGEVFLFLLTFTHESLPEPIRLVNDIDPIISRGNDFIAFPLEITLPMDDGENLPTLQISCQNASLELIDEIRSLQSPMSMKIELILASTPDYVEYEIDEMRVASVEYTKDSLTLTCTVDDLMNTSFPKERYLPSNFAGLFK